MLVMPAQIAFIHGYLPIPGDFTATSLSTVEGVGYTGEIAASAWCLLGMRDKLLLSRGRDLVKSVLVKSLDLRRKSLDCVGGKGASQTLEY